MQQVPVTAVPSQTLSIVLLGQNAQISLYQKGTGDSAALYLDLHIDSTPIALARVCRNRIRVLLDLQYKPFVGDLVIIDTKGDTQPEYTGLGTRYLLLYLEPADLV